MKKKKKKKKKKGGRERERERILIERKGHTSERVGVVTAHVISVDDPSFESRAHVESAHRGV